MATHPRHRTTREERFSNDEMDARIAALAKRNGIGGELVIRRIDPAAGPAARASAAEAVLLALSNGRPAVVSYLAYTTGLSRATVSNALAELAAAGRVVVAGTKRQAAGAPQRLWRLLDG